jgi:hypothetical protein
MVYIIHKIYMVFCLLSSVLLIKETTGCVSLNRCWWICIIYTIDLTGPCANRTSLTPSLFFKTACIEPGKWAVSDMCVGGQTSVTQVLDVWIPLLPKGKKINLVKFYFVEKGGSTGKRGLHTIQHSLIKFVSDLREGQ